MSFGIARGFGSTPPDKGSFPLDHHAECKAFIGGYLACLKEHSNKHHVCKELSKEYLACRMDKGLMEREDLDELGYKHTVEIDDAAEARAFEQRKERFGFFGGLTVKAAPKAGAKAQTRTTPTRE